MVGR
jgi:hypothetical protein